MPTNNEILQDLDAAYLGSVDARERLMKLLPGPTYRELLARDLQIAMETRSEDERDDAYSRMMSILGVAWEE